MHTKSNKSNQLNRILLYILPCIALSIVGMLYIVSHLVSVSSVNAESSSDSMNVSVQAESLNVSLESNSIILDIAPTYEGIFKSTNPVKVYVDTTNTYGYNLIMTATTTTSLTSTVPLSDGTTYPTIATLGDDNGGSGYDSTNFPTNRWGYAVNGSNFLPVANSTTLRTTNGTDNTADRTNNLSFGTKLNTEITTGNYNITLNFVATTNSPSNLEDFDAAFIFAGKTKYNGYYKMQDMTANICSYVATPTTTTSAPSTQLIDTRDNKIYWVSKLKDGNCWMTQNLDLDLSSSVALTSANTDLHSVDSWTPVRSTINASGNTMNTYPTNTNNWATDGTNSWSNDEYTPYSVDAGYKYILPIEKTAAGAGAWNDQPYDTVYNSLAECQAAASDSSKNSFGLACDGHTSVGNYYNFAAANATNNVETTLGGSANVVQNAVMPDSICPAGWRLPKDSSDSSKNEFAVLLGSANYNVTSSFNPSGLNVIRKAPLHFVRSGYVIGSTLYYVGVSGNAWSSTIGGTTIGYYPYFNSSEINPAGSNSRVSGFPVRCLARTSISDITYMQEFANLTDAEKEEVKTTMVTGQAYQLIDNRDNEVYNVAKLADGNVWLLDNLRLDPATLLQQLTPANTNMDPSTPFTLPETTLETTVTEIEYTTPKIYDLNRNEVDNHGWKYGVGYNYCATSAGTYCYDENSGTGDAQYDICPSGWRLPTGNTSGELWGLYKSYGSNYDNFVNAFHVVLTGRYSPFHGGTYIEDGTDTNIWASTYHVSPKAMFKIRITSPDQVVSASTTRDERLTVRCILK